MRLIDGDRLKLMRVSVCQTIDGELYIPHKDVMRAIDEAETIEQLSFHALTANAYQKSALRTESHVGEHSRLLQGLMGLCGESGECIDILKKSLYQGHILDTEHLAKELGDVAWYLAVAADALGYDLETILKMNIDKLAARYPEGFDSDLSVHRNKEDI